MLLRKQSLSLGLKMFHHQLGYRHHPGVVGFRGTKVAAPYSTFDVQHPTLEVSPLYSRCLTEPHAAKGQDQDHGEEVLGKNPFLRQPLSGRNQQPQLLGGEHSTSRSTCSPLLERRNGNGSV